MQMQLFDSSMTETMDILLLFSVVALSSVHCQQFPEGQDDYMASMIEQMTSGLPPGSQELICSALCNDGNTGGTGISRTGASVAVLSQQLDKMQAMLAALEHKLGNIQNSSNQGGVPEIWKKKYYVYHVVSDYERYQYTLEDARLACRESGGTLASFKQLQAAYDEGLDLCSCGWVSDGFAAYPIHYPREGCNEKMPPGMRDCGWQSTWNAWCFESA